MRRLLTFLLTPALAVPLVLATAGTSSAAIPTANQQAMQAALEQIVTNGIVGATAYVSGPAGTWTSAAGRTDLTTSGTAARPTDPMRIGSVSKTMTATLAMQQVQDGRLTLSTTVESVLPGLLPGHGNVTLEQLLSHRSGIPDYMDGLMAGVSGPNDLVNNLKVAHSDQDILSYALSRGWDFTPGSSFRYSNTGYLVVGMMVSKVSGQSLGSLFQSRIFTPAGMTTASYNLGQLTGRQLTEHFSYGGSRYSVATAVGQNYGPGGAVAASVADLDAFFDALMTGKLLRQDLLDQMLVPRSTGWAYALGIYATADACGTMMYGHDGRTYGARTVSFATRDGSRQISIEMNVRDLNEPTREVSADDLLWKASQAIC